MRQFICLTALALITACAGGQEPSRSPDAGNASNGHGANNAGCTPQSPTALCVGAGLLCGMHQVFDNCGTQRTIDCGACDGGTLDAGIADDGGSGHDDAGSSDAGNVRDAGSEQDAGLACASGMLCGMTCVDTRSDPDNCGTCGKHCPAGAACDNGLCACAVGQSICPDGCVEFQNDAKNCGACSRACDGYCDAGNCDCTGGLMPCGSACISPGSDPHNCGGCGNDCGPGKCLDGVCTYDADAGCYLPNATCDNASGPGCCNGTCSSNGQCPYAKAGQSCVAAWECAGYRCQTTPSFPGTRCCAPAGDIAPGGVSGGTCAGCCSGQCAYDNSCFNEGKAWCCH